MLLVTSAYARALKDFVTSIRREKNSIYLELEVQDFYHFFPLFSNSFSTEKAREIRIIVKLVHLQVVKKYFLS